MRQWFAVAFAGCAAACASSTASLEDKAARARADDQTLVVEFYADWCRVCDRFERTVLRDERVQAAMRDVRFVRLDAERGRGRIEAKRLGVTGYPTLYVLDAEGTPVAMVRGLPTVDYFLGFLEWGQVHAWDEAMMKRRLARGRSVASLRMAARWFAENGRVDDALAHYDEAIAGGAGPALSWEREQVRAAGGTRRAWAEAAARFLAEHPVGKPGLDALRVVVLSGGLAPDEIGAAVDAYLPAVGDEASQLDASVYVLLAGGLFERAQRAADRLVERWPKLTLFRETRTAARERAYKDRRAASHRDWVAARIDDLRIK